MNSSPPDPDTIDIYSFLVSLQASKVLLWIEGQQLKCLAPKGIIDQRTKQILDEQKQQICSILRTRSIFTLPLKQGSVSKAISSSSGTTVDNDCLILIQMGTLKFPLFCVHVISGLVPDFALLGDYLGPTQTMYAFQAVGVNGKRKPLSSIEEMARYYISQMLTAQPEGPYFICGWSIGGLVAFEMAQQLTAQSKQVAYLGLFDTQVSAQPIPKNETLRRVMFWRAFVRLTTGPDDFAYSFDHPFWRMTESEKLECVFAQAKSVQSLKLHNGNYSLSSFVGFFRCVQKFHTACLNYNPRPYPGKVTFYEADQGDQRLKARRSWSALALGGCDVVTVPGDHLSIMMPSGVEGLALRMRSSLENTYRRVAAGEN